MGEQDLREEVVRVPEATETTPGGRPTSPRAADRRAPISRSPHPVWAVGALLLFALAIALMDHGVVDERLRAGVLELRRSLPAEVRSLLEIGAKLLEKASSVPVTFSAAAVVGTYAAVSRRDPRPGVVLIVTVIALLVVGDVLKGAFDRPAPEEWASLQTSGRAFPSGHTAQAVAVWGSVAVLAFRHGRGRVSTFIGVAALGLAVGATLSRLLLDAHWVSDVIAGIALGGAALILAVASFAVAPVAGPSRATSDVVDLRTG